MKKKTVKKTDKNLPPKALKQPFVLEKDWVQGGLSSIEYTEVNPSGDWTAYLPTREPQKFKFDTNECSTISATKCLEIQLNFLKSLFTKEALNWFTDNGYIDESGSFNLSERFSGIKAGTSINGNSQNYVWESIRKVGFLPQKDLSYSLEQSNKFITQWAMCEDYYNPDVVTEAMEKKAKGVFQWITVQYEWVGANSKKTTDPKALIKALKQAPIQIGTPVCPDWNSGNVHSCNNKEVAHATTIYCSNKDGSWDDFDHYNPYLKTLSKDYFIPYSIKAVVTLNPVASVPYVTFDVLMQFINVLKKIGLLASKGLRSLGFVA